MSISMEIVTRCPRCSTAFRASPEHLAARNGMVRCGRCDNVFDARQHALSINAETEPVRHPPEAPSDQAHEALELTYAPAEAPQAEHGPDGHDEAAFSTETADPNLELDFGKPSGASRGARPWLMAVVTALLILCLAGQATFHFRGDIALLFPAAKPAMERACAQFGCRLPLPKRADMLSIESSDLQADTLNPGIMVLSATLRNRAPFSQTPPALELTLTDGQDQALARRVLAPADYVQRSGMGNPAENSVLGENLFPGGTELPIRVYFDASAVKPTGYRLYLFYP